VLVDPEDPRGGGSGELIALITTITGPHPGPRPSGGAGLPTPAVGTRESNDQLRPTRAAPAKSCAPRKPTSSARKSKAPANPLRDQRKICRPRAHRHQNPPPWPAYNPDRQCLQRSIFDQTQDKWCWGPGRYPASHTGRLTKVSVMSAHFPDSGGHRNSSSPMSSIGFLNASVS
jgi:hypothetical protein